MLLCPEAQTMHQKAHLSSENFTKRTYPTIPNINGRLSGLDFAVVAFAPVCGPGVVCSRLETVEVPFSFVTVPGSDVGVESLSIKSFSSASKIDSTNNSGIELLRII